MRHLWTPVLGLWLGLSPIAHAQEPPPLWDEVIEGADLIARVRVTEPGRFGAKVEVEEVFLGEKPGVPFLVVGFNDGSFPPEIIEMEEMRRDEVLWLFLNRWEPKPAGFLIPTWFEEGWDPAAEVTFMPATTSSGDVPMRNGKARVRLTAGGYHHPAPEMGMDEWEELLRALIARVKREEVDQALIARNQSCLDAGVRGNAMLLDESPAVRCIAKLRLLGDTSGPAALLGFLQADELTLGAAAGLAAHSNDASLDPLIEAMVASDNPDTPMMFVMLAALGGEEHASRVLAPMLAASRQPRPYNGIPLDTLRSPAFRQRVLSLLASLPHPAVAETLKAELRFLNPEELMIAIDALEAIESGSWIKPATALFAQPEIQRTMAILESIKIYRPADAAPGLTQLAQAADIDPGLRREAIAALGLIQHEDAATAIDERLKANLTFVGAWSDDRVDQIATDLSALVRLRPERAAEHAWTIARQYLAYPRSLVYSDFYEESTREVTLLERAALRILPPGSTVSVRVITEKEDSFMTRGERAVIVDASSASGVSPSQRANLAIAVGTSPKRVRLCGPDPRGKYRCLEERGSVWIPHGRLILPVLQAIGRAAGLSEQPTYPIDPAAVEWLGKALTQPWLRNSVSEEAVWELWGQRFYGPVLPEEMPPLVPEGLPAFNPDAPAR